MMLMSVYYEIESTFRKQLCEETAVFHHVVCTQTNILVQDWMVVTDGNVEQTGPFAERRIDLLELLVCYSTSFRQCFVRMASG